MPTAGDTLHFTPVVEVPVTDEANCWVLPPVRLTLCGETPTLMPPVPPVSVSVPLTALAASDDPSTNAALKLESCSARFPDAVLLVVTVRLATVPEGILVAPPHSTHCTPLQESDLPAAAAPLDTVAVTAVTFGILIVQPSEVGAGLAERLSGIVTVLPGFALTEPTWMVLKEYPGNANNENRNASFTK
jgi:hypothetical protein